MKIKERLVVPMALLVVTLLGLSAYFYPKYFKTAENYNEKEMMLLDTDALSAQVEENSQLKTEILRLNNEIKQQSEINKRYSDSFGKLTEVSEPFTTPSNAISAKVGTSFDLPIKFQTGDSGKLAVQVTKIKKYMPEYEYGKYFVYTDTCQEGIVECLPHSIPEEVNPGEAVVSISLTYKNLTKNQSAYVVVDDHFLALVDDNLYHPYGSYLGKNINSGKIERFEKKVFNLYPLTSYNHNLLIKVPVNTKELTLTYGVDLENLNNALSFMIE